MESNVHGRCRISFYMVTLAIVGAAWTSQSTAAAAVSFDVQTVVACRNVAAPNGVDVDPDQRLVEVQFHVSALVRDRSRLIEYFYRIDCQNAVEVVGYSPRTRLASRYAEKITVEDKDEKSKSLGVSLNGNVATFAAGSAGADVGTKNHKIVRYALKPPMETVTASGTLNRGRSVYFKLRSTPQQTLEGAKRFSVILRVPAHWQADYVSLKCEARCRQRSYPGTKQQASLCASQRFMVTLYEAGNVHAKQAAERFSSAEQQLRAASAANTKQLKKRAFPSIVHRLGAAIDMYEPKIPANWLQLVMTGKVGPRHAMVNAFPAEVRIAVTEFWESRSDIARMRNS